MGRPQTNGKKWAAPAAAAATAFEHNNSIFKRIGAAAKCVRADVWEWLSAYSCTTWAIRGSGLNHVEDLSRHSAGI